MTVLADATSIADLNDWVDLGASYTVLQDTGNIETSNWNVTDRPMFVVLDENLIIQFRASNESGLNGAESTATTLLNGM